MGQKVRVGILCGGKSAEHEVSLQSAKNVCDAIDRDKYDVTIIGIDKSGQWFLEDRAVLEAKSANASLPAITEQDKSKAVNLVHESSGSQLVKAVGGDVLEPLDVIFPVLHGTFGEDGTVQGLLKLANIPFVGAGVLGSAVGMDKDVMKRLFRDAGIPTPRFIAADRGRARDLRFGDVVEELGLPLFVKPANLGSSVGVSRVNDAAGFPPALGEAFRYDRKIIIEEFIDGREIECSVLGNEEPIASAVGEIVPQGEHEFYTYEAKYLDENGAVLKIPADLPDPVIRKVQETAVAAYRAICCEGMARADFFLRGEDEVQINELNTIPGFTRISMYPKLWEQSGVS